MANIAFSYRDHSEPCGGGAVHGYQVVEQLRRLGHHLLTAEPRSDARLERYPRTLSGMQRLLRAADAVYLRCDARTWDIAMLAANRAVTKKPVVVEVNAIAEETLAYGGGPFRRLNALALRRQYHGIVRMSDAVVCVSEQLAAFVRRTYPVRAESVFVAPNGGCPVAALPRGRDDGEFRVIWAGSSRFPWQALDLVVRVAEKLVAAVPQARVVLYGDSDVTRFAGFPGITVEQAVPHSAMPEVLAKVDAALCLYRPMPRGPAGFYNSPLKLFDYMAAGLPVVASALGQIADVIEHDKSGILVGADVDQISAALVRLARDGERRRALGAAALKRIRQRYTWAHTGDVIAAALRAAGVGCAINRPNLVI